jgi:hypothetical protein
MLNCQLKEIFLRCPVFFFLFFASSIYAQNVAFDTVIDRFIPIDFCEVPKLLTGAPSIFTYSHSGLDIGYSFANIRGFDQRRQSILINGVPQNDPEDHNVYWIDMPDLAASASEIQLHNGIGTALYGEPAMGGSINIITGLSTKREFNVSAGYGDFNTSKLGVTVNSGLIDDKYLIYARLMDIEMHRLLTKNPIASRWSAAIQDLLYN